MRWTDLMDVLACPACGAGLRRRGEAGIDCTGCAAAFPVESDVPLLFASEPATRAFYESAGRRERRPSPRFDLLPSVKAGGSWLEGSDAVARGGPLARQAPWVLEVGCGWGSARHYGVTDRHVGLDLSHSMLVEMLGRMPASAALAADAARLPFRDGTVPFVMTNAFLEHVPSPEPVLAEIARVLAPGGTACHADAWHVRPWARTGVTLVSWRNATWRERLIKASLLLRERRAVRAASVLPQRALAEIRFAAGATPRPLAFRALEPNYELNLFSDEDAVASIDPHEVLLYYLRRGFESLGPKTALRRVLLRGQILLVRKAT